MDKKWLTPSSLPWRRRQTQRVSVHLQSVTFELSFGTDTFNVSPNQSSASDLEFAVYFQKYTAKDSTTDFLVNQNQVWFDVTATAALSVTSHRVAPGL